MPPGSPVPFIRTLQNPLTAQETRPTRDAVTFEPAHRSSNADRSSA